MLKNWIIRKLGGFTESEMKLVLNALDKTVLEKVRIELADIRQVREHMDVVKVNCVVNWPLCGGEDGKRLGEIVDCLERDFHCRITDELWNYAEKRLDVLTKENMVQARATLYVLNQENKKEVQ